MHRLALLLVPALLTAQEPAQPEPRDLLRQTADAIRKYKSYQLDSLSVIEMKGGINNKMEMPSSISVRRPDRMRIESRNQVASMTMVSDGEHTWMYLAPLKQYIKRPAAATPEAAVANSGLLKGLPDITKSIKSVKLNGEDSIDIEGVDFPSWVVETRYNKIEMPEQGMTVLDAVQLTWISKMHRLTLQTSFGARLKMPSIDVPVEMTQVTRTVSLKLDPDLPDSLFGFKPPEGARETPDWTLPGVSKPDVIGKAAPAFAARALDGKEINLAALRGKVVLLDFWATWCGPCKRELPYIEKIHREFGSKGLVVLGMNVGDEKEAIEKFLKTATLTYPVVPVDPASELLSTLSVNAFPTVVLIDREGKLSAYEVGARGEAALRADLAKLGILGPK